MSADGMAEIAAQHVAEPARVLHRQRLIEPELGAQGGDGLWIGVLPEHDLHRVARGQVQHEENAQAEDQQHWQRAEQAAADETQHQPAGLTSNPWTVFSAAKLVGGKYVKTYAASSLMVFWICWKICLRVAWSPACRSRTIASSIAGELYLP